MRKQMAGFLLVLVTGGVCAGARAQGLPLTHLPNRIIDPALGMGADGVDDAWILVDDDRQVVEAQIRWDLFPYAFAADVMSNEVDACGDRHIYALRESVPRVSPYALTEFNVTIYGRTQDAPVECGPLPDDRISVHLRTRSHDGVTTRSYMTAPAT